MASSGSTSVDGPDFICIGMPKAGTGWLFDQVQYHPDFWMPPIKEFDYLMRDVPRLKNIRERLKRYARRQQTANPTDQPIRWPNRRPGDARDIEFLQEASACSGQPMDIDRYAPLFRFKGDLLSGDVSPTYVTLKDEVIARIGERLPRARIILMVRDPIARAASQISMAYRRDKFNESLIDDAEGFRAYLARAKTTTKEAFPTELIARWKRNAPKMNLRCFFFDDIEREPDRARAEILSFLGADPDKKSGDLAASHNRKSKAKKLVLTDKAKAVLVDHFADEVRACAALFGGPAQEWVSRYGL